MATRPSQLSYIPYWNNYGKGGRVDIQRKVESGYRVRVENMGSERNG